MMTMRDEKNMLRILKKLYKTGGNGRIAASFLLCVSPKGKG